MEQSESIGDICIPYAAAPRCRLVSVPRGALAVCWRQKANSTNGQLSARGVVHRNVLEAPSLQGSSGTKAECTMLSGGAAGEASEAGRS
eukprot:scaffold3984_cov65-Phaeocystis_antarctica.AAC.2